MTVIPAHRDLLAIDEAKAIADRLYRFWANRGARIDFDVVHDHVGFCVRSNMLNGWPRREGSADAVGT